MDPRNLKHIDVVAGLICESGRVLVCQRSSKAGFPLKWEFPGGKVEEGEAREDALRRELREELGIEVDSTNKIYQHTHTYPGISEVNLTFFQIQKYRGTAKNLVFEQIAWVALGDLPQFDFLDGDLPLIEKLARGGEIELL